MPVSIREMRSGDAGGIRAFNARLEKAGVSFAFPTDTSELMQEEPAVEAPYQTAYVLTDGVAVHGGYILKHEQLFASLGGFAAGNYQLPLSEGIIDRKYAMGGIQLIKDALARQSRLYCLGMGSTGRPLPQLLSRLGWAVSKVPFFFRIENAGAFTREIRWLRRRASLLYVLDIANYTGTLAGLVALARLYRRAFGPRMPAGVSVHEVPDFPQDIDGLFASVRGAYGLLGDRRAAAMRKKLPLRDPRLSCLVFRRSGALVGWVVFSVSHLRNHTQFGNMKLGSIIDGLAAPADVGLLISEACKRMELAECDLLVSNQSHPGWISALRRHGFLEGPSNFVLALSPQLAAAREAVTLAHFNRADGDGPINL